MIFIIPILLATMGLRSTTGMSSLEQMLNSRSIVQRSLLHKKEEDRKKPESCISFEEERIHAHCLGILPHSFFVLSTNSFRVPI